MSRRMKKIRQQRALKSTQSSLNTQEKYDLIKRPIITEKSLEVTDKKVYTFEVDKKATKPEIKAALEEVFEVKIKAIRTSVVKKKPKTVGKYSGYRSGYKKAIVKLTDDSKEIESFEV